MAAALVLAAGTAMAAGHSHGAHASARRRAAPARRARRASATPSPPPSPDAQRYFDQGLRLIYAFNHDEAIRAFQEAARLDPDCAMA